MISFKQFLEDSQVRLPSDEHQAVKDHLRDSTWINGSLRNAHRQGDLHPRQKQHIESMDKAIEKAPPLKTSLTVYRAISQGAPFLDNLKVGDTFVDRGYVNTSIEKSAVYNPGYVHPTDRLVMTIHIPAGIKVLVTNDVIQHDDDPRARSLASEEKEHILGRGHTFKIKRMSKKAMTVDVVK
jgi:hypothetical protein